VTEHVLSSAEATHELARHLGECIRAPIWVGLEGDLGAGKTHFVQGLAEGLGVPASSPVVSPTFTLVNEYRGGRMDLIHVDLYRIKKEVELDEIGLFEFEDGAEVVAVEWCDRFAVMPDDHLRVKLQVVDDCTRTLDAVATGAGAEELLGRWRAHW
jgi:tRNA threonylcarbamoyladenosine biosynthesis protein TsaE